MAGLHDAALTERDAELSVIDQGIAAVRRGSSRLLVIEGEAGIGKTRLLAAARERARVAELSDLHAHASPLERSYAFGVVRQLFEPALSALDRKQREEVLSGHARGATRPLALDPNARRNGEDAMYTALNGLYWLCLNFAERAPLSLTIDDAHWADEPSLRFISFVASRLDEAPVLVALTARPGEPGTDAQAVISDLQSFPFVETLALRPLSSAAVESLTEAALGRGANTSFAAACHTATGGNPLLLHELLIEAKAAGIAPTDEGAGRIAALGPARVSAGVLARVGRLGASAVRLTEALAVLGDNARLPHAAALAGLDEQEAQRAATALIDAGVLLEAFPLSFTHPLVRQAIYEHLPYGERLAAHDRAAGILHAAGTRAEAIASHLLLTQPQGSGEVVELLRRAAADATAQGSPDCAAQYLRRALIEPPAAELRGELLAELGIAEHNSGDPKAVVHLSEALDLAAVPEQRARLGLVLAARSGTQATSPEPCHCWQASSTGSTDR